MFVLAVMVATACGGGHPPAGVPPATTAAAATTVAPTTTSGPPAPPPTSATTAASPPATVPAAPAQVITHGTPSEKVIALTFDAGSDAGHAADILAYLEAHHIPATFGVTGVWAAGNPGLVRRMAADGDQIVNHSWDHPSFTGYSTATAALTPAEEREQLSSTDELVLRLTGRGTQPWFRPPYGDRDSQVDAVVGAAGYRYELMWTVDSLGWKGLDPAAVAERCLAQAAPGAIILMHVGSASTDSAALPSLVAALQQSGFGFVTVSRMFP